MKWQNCEIYMATISVTRGHLMPISECNFRVTKLVYIYHNSRLLKTVKQEDNKGSSESNNDDTDRDETHSDDDDAGDL